MSLLPDVVAASAKRKSEEVTPEKDGSAPVDRRPKKNKSLFGPVPENSFVLLVGEADFSFAKAYSNRHRLACKRLFATELRDESVLAATYGKFEANKQHVEAKGAKVLFGVDATKLHEHEILKKHFFAEIHFNCPHDGSDDPKYIVVPQLIADFFKSARLIQNDGGQILMALPRQEGEKNDFRKGVRYDVYDAARNAGYQLSEKKLMFERYNGYQHVVVQADRSTPAADVLRQYIFTKTNLSPEEILQQDKASEVFAPEVKSFAIDMKKVLTRCVLPEPPTPPASSQPSQSSQPSLFSPFSPAFFGSSPPGSPLVNLPKITLPPVSGAAQSTNRSKKE